MKKLIILVLILAALMFFSLSVLKTDKDTQDPSTDPVIESKDINHVFTELKISMNVPKDLSVVKEPVFSPDDGKLDAYTFYIERVNNSEMSMKNYFQMYGLYQFELPKLTEDDFEKIKSDNVTYKYINEINYGGIKGYEAQFSGQRDRFVYMFLVDGRILNIAVSEATPENKELADKIVSTLQIVNSEN